MSTIEILCGNIFCAIRVSKVTCTQLSIKLETALKGFKLRFGSGFGESYTVNFDSLSVDETCHKYKFKISGQLSYCEF